MYQALLTRRYLTSKIMPLLAALAVTLCVATELIVWSVMGGFLNMLKESGRTLIGDVGITWPNIGFAHYEDLIRRLEADPLVAAASPAIETQGLIRMPGGRIEGVLIKGIEPGTFDKVTRFDELLWWRWLEKPLPKDKKGEDPRLNPEYQSFMRKLLEDGRRFKWRDRLTGVDRPGIVLGIEVESKRGLRRPEGWIAGDFFMPEQDVTLSVFPMDRSGQTVDLNLKARTFTVVNEVRSGLYELDANVVYVDLAELQRMQKMDAARRAVEEPDPFETTTNPATGLAEFVSPEAEGVDPARVTSVFVRAIPDERASETGRGPVSADELRSRAEEIYAAFAADHPDVPAAERIDISTWEDRNRTLISAVEKETGLVMFIFGIISLTSVFLVLAIFWSMVSEKTKDIGVLRSIGASRAGVAWLWLRYGLAIGVVGSVLGLGAAWLIVTNINPIHEWLGRTFGLTVWDPAVYYFTDIPNKIVTSHAALVFAGGLIASVFGALVPAVKAAHMDPVRALRFE